MTLIQHTNIKVRFEQQADNSRTYVLPFIEQTKTIDKNTTVFEVGTAEGGVLLPFIERGCYCVGVDLACYRIDTANEYLKEEVDAGKALFMCKNIYDDDFSARFKSFFDIIILKDVIEHVPEQLKFIAHLKTFLKPGGQIFFGFPPWYMPFGGHQQLAEGKWTSKLPWYHLLPRSLYKSVLKMGGEQPNIVQDLLDIYDTRISIERFQRIIKKNGLKVLKQQDYLINPIYKYKFGLQPRKQFPPFSWIPYFRDFVTTCVYYTVG